MRELYWVANYTDGSQLKQFQDGVEQKYADIDRERLERFDMLDIQTHKIILALYLHEGQKLIFRRRTFKYLDGTADTVVFLVGYQMTLMTNSGPRSVVVINYIHQDGSIALDGPRDNLKLLEFEY